MSFRYALLWAVDGKIRRAADPDVPAHKFPSAWEPRSVVLTAGDYQTAHRMAADALLHNWSQYRHEAEIFAVRPANPTDLSQFAYVSDPGFRVLVDEADDD